MKLHTSLGYKIYNQGPHVNQDKTKETSYSLIVLSVHTLPEIQSSKAEHTQRQHFPFTVLESDP